MIDFSPSEIAEYYAVRVPALKQGNQREWRGACPVHNGNGANFTVDSETGMAHCHSQCGQGWDIISLEMAMSGTDFPHAKVSVFRTIGRPEPSWEDRDIQATYDYADANGTVRYQVVRKAGKKFMQRRPDGQGGWMWGLGGVAPLPYRLPEWKDRPAVAVVEGEKDATTLWRLGIPATCNNGGAGNFKPELVPYFAGKRVMIFPDNDDPGRDHALKVAALLKGTAASVKIAELPNLPTKGDVSDFIGAGGTVAQIKAVCERAQEWTPEWQFSSDVPDENDQYVRTFEQTIAECGGLNQFWDLTKYEGIATPFKRLTKALAGGMRKGEFYVIGGNQGSGKTSLGLQFVLHAIRHQLGVLLFSMEMGWRDVFQRMVAIHAGVDLLEYRDLLFEAKKSGHDSEPLKAIRRDLQTATTELYQLPLLVSRKTRVTPDYLISEAKRLRARSRIDLIVVDHMQLMSSTGKERGDYEKFTAISRATKEMAVMIDTPVLILSQTSRRNSNEGHTELEDSDLRGSGAIEEDAAGTMFIYPDAEERKNRLADKTFSFGCKSWLKLSKNRFGLGAMYLELNHNKRFTRFELPCEEQHA